MPRTDDDPEAILRTISTAATLLAALALPGALAAASQRIEVRVIDDAAKPVAGVSVAVAASEGEAFEASASTDDRGVAVFELPNAKRPYRLRAEHSDYAAFEQTFDLGAQKAPRGDVVLLEVSLSPPGPGDRFNRAVRALRADDLATAEAELRLAVELDPGFARGWTVLALTLLESERPEEALAAVDRSLAAAPDEIDALRLRYDALSKLGRGAEAETTLDRLAERDRSPELSRLLFNSGANAANAGQAELARRRLAQALERDASLWQAHSALAELEIRDKNLEGALAELDQALAVSPREMRVWERKLEVLRALGRGEDAAAAEARLAELRAEG